MKLAKEILGFDDGQPIDAEMVRKKYRLKALKYHPDKNPLPNASLEFIKINEAYDFLRHERSSLSLTDYDYKSLFMSFLKHVWGGDIESNELFYTIFEKLSSICQNTDDISPLLKKMMKNVETFILIRLYAITQKYGDVFHIPELLSILLKEVIEEKEREENTTTFPCIYLHPLLEDLFEEKLYKFERDGSTYIVPLWHHELIYDENFKVKCQPILPHHCRLDDENNIMVSLSFSFHTIIEMEYIDFELGDKRFRILREALKLKKTQVYKMRGKGIPKINRLELLDVSKKSDILVSISMV